MRSLRKRVLPSESTFLRKKKSMSGGNVTEKITPETYEKMNEEFEEDGLAFRINIPTQEEIDEWRERG